jgi:hypothetical protein
MNVKFIENKILRLCVQPRTFDFISNNLDGLDPIQVSESLGSLENQGMIHLKNDLWSIKEESKPPVLDLSTPDPQLYLKKYMGYFDFLKTPHPLDFEWRNSTASLRFLISRVQEMNTVNDEILFLGLPTLFAMACQRDIPQRVTLVERNKPIVKSLSRLNINKERLRIISEDIFRVKPETIGNFHSVFMDPPWYSPFFYQFMWLAAKCVKEGGIVAISLPPVNTRPNIPAERIDWFTFCNEQGLCLESLSPQTLQYAMPFFEFNAFRSAGIKSTTPFWRSGDLAVFRKVTSGSTVRPSFHDVGNKWIEKEIETVRIRVRIGEKVDAKLPIVFESIVKGDILPTVSARDERREHANVWTSGNRIFKVSNPEKLISALNSIKAGNKDLGKEEKEVLYFVEMLAELEKKEYNDYLDWLYHEMERQIN